MFPRVTHARPRRICKNHLRRFSATLIVFICAAFSFSFVSRVGAFDSQGEIIPLTVGSPRNGELKGDDAHSFSVGLRAGEYARINVQRNGIDVLVKVTSPGHDSTQYESPAGPYSPMTLSIIATTEGQYTIEIRPIERWLAPGRYVIALEDLREAKPQDQKRVAAERKVAECRSTQLLDTSESVRAARDCYQQALPLWQELGDAVEEANTLQFIAQTYRNADSKKSYLDARERRGETDRQAIAYTVLEMAGAYLNSIAFEDALRTYDEAFNLFGAIPNRRGQAAALYGKGLTKARMVKMTEALEDYGKALLIYTAADTRDRHEEARTLHAMGGAYDVLGDPAKAKEYFDRALEGWRETRDPGQEGNTYSSLAKLEMDHGNWQAAFDTYDKAFERYALGEAASIREKPALRRRRASSLYGVAYTYAALGDYSTALEMLKQSLSLREPPGRGSTLMLTCYFEALSGQPEKALDTCAVGIAEQQASGDPRIGETFTALGAANAMLGKHQEAIALYQEALKYQTNGKSPQAEAITQGWLGESLTALGKHEKALASYERARALWQQYNEPNGVAVALIGMARVERARDHLTVALDYVTKAIDNIEPLRTNVTSEQLRTNYFATKIDYYELYIDLSMQLAEQTKNPEFIAAAFDASERARARSLLETLSKARFEDVRQAEPELGKLVDSYRYVQSEIQTLRQKKLDPQTKIRLESEFRKKQAQLELELRTKYGQYAALMFPQPLKAAEVQKLLDPDTLLLEFALGEERSYVWAVTATELRGYKLPPRSELEKTTQQLITRLAAGQRLPGEMAAAYSERLPRELNQYLPEAAAFSRLLLGKIPELAQKKHLVIVGDGPLPYLPFAALPAPGSASSGPGPTLNDLLVRDHEITNLPSASVLSLLRQTAGRARPPKLLAVFADPVLEKDDARILRAHRPKTDRPPAASKDALAQALRDFNDANTATELPRLPTSGFEARQIVELAGRASSLQEIGFDANRENATSKKLGQYRFVHFATHGLLNEVEPQFSGVVLSLYDRNGNYHSDGYLRLMDIYRLNLPVEMVVLSACRTGLGKRVRGEGLIGLSRGFMYAGAQRVLASVWKVDDEATAELMKRFYGKMLKEGMTPAAALSAAQWSMSKDNRWSNPYFWAGFVLQGESK
jgi:CHAT domain-containing protein/tetratricopeptide (TPR) repeat protein